MNPYELKLCDIQGRLFELAGKDKYDSPEFIKTYMESDIAKNLDSKFNRYQWAGEEYLLEELTDNINIPKSNTTYSNEVLYWTGYIYRYWHFYKNISSNKIIKLASPETMNRNYHMFHTNDPTIAIDDLIEMHSQKHERQ